MSDAAETSINTRIDYSRCEDTFIFY